MSSNVSNPPPTSTDAANNSSAVVADNLIASVNIPINQQAEDHIYQLSSRFALSLVLQAKLLAFRRKNEMVLRAHVDEAEKSLYIKKDRPWWQDALVALGSLVLGVGIQGFLTEISNAANIRPSWAFGYFITTITGLALVFIGYIIQSRI